MDNEESQSEICWKIMFYLVSMYFGLLDGSSFI